MSLVVVGSMAFGLAVMVVAAPSIGVIDAWRAAITAIVLSVSGVLLLVVAQVRLLRSAWLKVGLQLPARRSGDPVATSPPALPAPPLYPTALLPTGGGAVVPNWSQQRDPNPDGLLDPYWAEDCGEQAICMVTYACRGVEVPEGVVRYQMGGPHRRGLTNAHDLVSQLVRWHFPASARAASAVDALAYVAGAAGAGRPCIVLGHWLSPALLHWVVVVEVTGQNVIVSDPWYGNRRSIPTLVFQEQYAGWTVDPGEAVRYA